MHAFPVQARALAAAPERVAPVPGRLGTELNDRVAVARHRVVVAVAVHDAGEPAPLVGDREMPPSHQLGLDFAELGSHPLLAGDALEREASAPGLRADVREAEELERLRLPESSLLTSLGGEPAELDQPRLLRVQLQRELREALAKVREEALGVVPMLEA